MAHKYAVYIPQMDADRVEVSAKDKWNALEKARQIWLEGTKDYIESFEFEMEDDVERVK